MTVGSLHCWLNHSWWKGQPICWFLTFMGPCIVNIFLSMTNKMQRCKILFITVSALHVSSGFPAHHQELKTVHETSGIWQTCLLLPLAACTDLTSWWRAEKPFETCTALTIIKSIIQCCILLAMLKNVFAGTDTISLKQQMATHVTIIHRQQKTNFSVIRVYHTKAMDHTLLPHNDTRCTFNQSSLFTTVK